MWNVALQEADGDQDGEHQRQQPKRPARGRGGRNGRGRGVLLRELTLQIFDFGAEARFGVFGHLFVFHFSRCPGGLRGRRRLRACPT